MSKFKEWLSKRARPGITKTVTYKVMPEHGKNIGLPPEGEITLTIDGTCPCSVCGHKYMYECEEADCKCCTSICN